jgi:drug/metabolite transporter (DMT)-like permease
MLPVFGGHRLSWMSLPSTVGILLGCVLIVMSGPRNDKAYLASEILALVPTFTCLAVVLVLGGTGEYHVLLYSLFIYMYVCCVLVSEGLVCDV